MYMTVNSVPVYDTPNHDVPLRIHTQKLADHYMVDPLEDLAYPMVHHPGLL